MDQFQARTDPHKGNGGNVMEGWAFSEYDDTLKPILDHFSGNMKATINHLTTVHNETCGCQMDSASQEVANKVWNQKKVPFMELQKQSGLDFEDYLNRVLRLLLTKSIHDISPVLESDFWKELRTSYPSDNAKIPMESMEEDLADINNYIAKDIGPVELNQVFLPTTPEDIDLDQDPAKEFLVTKVPTASSNNSSSSFNSSPLSSVGCINSVADELLRKKRTEKHMAPIDCTGVSSAFCMIWKCKPCDLQHQSKEDCGHYKNYHYPFQSIANNLDHPHELPIELEQRHDGIYTKGQGIKPFTRLGPLKGQIRKESEMDFDEDRSHIWLIYCNNGDRKCVMTTSKKDSNWFREVIPAESSTTANVLAISIVNDLYLVSGPSGIPPFTKLKYFAKEDPTTEFWTSWTQAWANQKRCSRCSIHGQFDSVADYRVHISLWHDVSFQGNPQNRIYYCPDCCSKRIGAKEIVQHCKDAHDSLPFHCRHCSKRFETYNSLIKHKNRIHSAEKPLKKSCDKCGKVYLDPKALRQHVKQVHERSRQLHCVKCEFIFSSKYALNRHVREVHQKHQEYACNLCNKQFTQQSNLKQHMLIHLGAKPFLCKHKGCHAAFTTKQCLQVHYRKVHHYDESNMPAIQKVNLDDVVNHKNTSSAAAVVVASEDSSSTQSGDFNTPTAAASLRNTNFVPNLGGIPSSQSTRPSMPMTTYDELTDPLDVTTYHAAADSESFDTKPNFQIS